MDEIKTLRSAATHLRQAAFAGWAVIRNNALADVIDAIAQRAEEVLDATPYAKDPTNPTARAIVSGATVGFDSAVTLARHILSDKD